MIIGWDIGGAHVKAALVDAGRVRDVALWACPLWHGLAHLDRALDTAQARWPEATHASHAVTMTGEMVDLFEHREEGVAALVARLAKAFGDRAHFFCGDGWLGAHDAVRHGRRVASANWAASAALVAGRLDAALLVDIGSTTTDIIAVAAGKVHARASDDPGRLASGELVYQGVVRTPLCALASRIIFGDREFNVMNELFATTADVYRLIGELDPAFDLHPSADGGAKDSTASCRRIARMIGFDARDANDRQWIEFAAHWRAAQLAQIRVNVERVLAASELPTGTPLVAAGCGDFLVRALAESIGRGCLGFDEVAGIDRQHATWARACAPSVAVALLFDKETH